MAKELTKKEILAQKEALEEKIDKLEEKIESKNAKRIKALEQEVADLTEENKLLILQQEDVETEAETVQSPTKSRKPLVQMSENELVEHMTKKLNHKKL